MMTKSQQYNTAFALCLLHAAFVSYAAWLPIGPNTDAFNKVFLFGVWPVLVFVWPLWLIALFILWRSGERKKWKLFIPIGVATLVMVPALLYLAAITSGVGP
jgi:hypothetical protein